MTDQAAYLSRPAVARYLFALGAVLIVLVLRVLLTPLTGTGAPFVLFFAAVLVTSLYAGAGPGLVALVTSLPVASTYSSSTRDTRFIKRSLRRSCTRSTGSSSFT
jgi:hypothetical protein